MNIKASAITNLSDARYFAAQYSVEWMGFCMEEGTATYMPTHVIQAMQEWIQGPKIVGEFGLTTTENIIESIQKIGLDAVQLPMYATVNRQAIRNIAPIIQEIIVEKSDSAAILLQKIAQFEAQFDVLYLDFEKSGWSFAEIVRHQDIHLEVIQRICQQHHTILAIDANSQQLKAIVQSTQPYALSLKGGEEERVGYKSYDELNDIFDALEL